MFSSVNSSIGPTGPYDLSPCSARNAIGLLKSVVFERLGMFFALRRQMAQIGVFCIQNSECPVWSDLVARFYSKINRDGFSLYGVIIALAVISILAATLGPAAFRKMMRARESDTERELVRIEAGLVGFYADVGRFPSEAEGLAALINDPGVTGWTGP
ncbi:MAG: type II secretory pathway pseudopilin PulG, partial [Candidatus Krumholzibacteriia bacterium]